MNPPETDAGQVPPPVGDSAGLRAEGGHPGEQDGEKGHLVDVVCVWVVLCVRAT